MKKVNSFAYSCFYIQPFLFFSFQLHILYEGEAIHLLIHFFIFSYFFSLSFIFILYMKRVNPFAYSLFHIELVLFSLVELHILYETSQSIYFVVVLHSAISFSCHHFLILYEFDHITVYVPVSILFAS